jgi:cation:H+ antiporter
MEVLVPIIGLIIALAVLARGVDIFTGGAKSLGSAFGMGARTIDVLVVGFGSSLPVLVVSLTALLQGSSDIALAYVVGSNIANILLILGISAFALGTLHVKADRDGTGITVFVLATVFMVLMLQDGVVDRLEALFLLGSCVAYVWHLRDGGEEGTIIRPSIRIQSVGYVIGGLAAIVVGALISIDMIGRLGTLLDVSLGLLALTVLAFGTTLPSLIGAIRSARHNDHALVIGSILSAHVFNTFFIIGILGMVTALTTDAVTVKVGLPILVASSLMVVIFAQVMRIGRFEGMMLLILFGYFLAKLIPFI